MSLRPSEEASSAPSEERDPSGSQSAAGVKAAESAATPSSGPAGGEVQDGEAPAVPTGRVADHAGPDAASHSASAAQPVPRGQATCPDNDAEANGTTTSANDGPPTGALATAAPTPLGQTAGGMDVDPEALAGTPDGVELQASRGPGPTGETQPGGIRVDAAGVAEASRGSASAADGQAPRGTDADAGGTTPPTAYSPTGGDAAESESPPVHSDGHEVGSMDVDASVGTPAQRLLADRVTTMVSVSVRAHRPETEEPRDAVSCLVCQQCENPVCTMDDLCTEKAVVWGDAVFAYEMDIHDKSYWTYSATNPSQKRYDVVRLKKQVLDEGLYAANVAASADHSWFPPYAWKVCECKSCGSFMGWAFFDAEGNPAFVGLMRQLPQRDVDHVPYQRERARALVVLRSQTPNQYLANQLASLVMDADTDLSLRHQVHTLSEQTEALQTLHHQEDHEADIDQAGDSDDTASESTESLESSPSAAVPPGPTAPAPTTDGPPAGADDTARPGAHTPPVEFREDSDPPRSTPP
ncbi:hypothetical protein DIPPA_17625 [Diplonema papillatum]|nr:hypothetical protein DIPPA_17625 [Diplonema papillatum]